MLCTVRVPDLNTKAIRAGQISSAHAIDRYFDLLHPIGVEATDRTLELFITDADRAFAHEMIVTKGIEADRPKVGLFPGGGMEVTRVDA